MKKWLLHIFLVSVLGMLTASCSQDVDELGLDDIPSKNANSEKVTIRFTIDLGDQAGMGSRATWEGYDGDGTGVSDKAGPGIGNENHINTSSLQVFLFNNNGTYIGGLKDMEANQTSTPHIYEIKGEVDVVKSAIEDEVLNCKIMVVANADAASVNDGKVTGYENNAAFDHGVTSIPMWGIGTYSINLIQQLQVNLREPIHMLRSMAKIEVKLGGYTDGSTQYDLYTMGYRITGATLNKYNTKGYVVPNFKTSSETTVELKDLSATTVLSTADVIRVYPSLAETSGKPTPKNFAESEAGKSYVIYIPEMANAYVDEEDVNGSIWIDLTLAKTNSNSSTGYDNITTSVMGGSPRIYLKDYIGTDGLYSPTRNHWYKYTINKINDGYNMALTCVVQNWSEAEVEEWVYTDQASHSSGGELKCTTEGALVVGNNDKYTGEVVTQGGRLNFEFQLDTPTDATWMAEFIKVDGDSNAFVFVAEDGTRSETMTGNVGTEAALVIEPTNPSISQNNSALLRISVKTKDGRTIVVKDLLPSGFDVNEYTIIHTK